MALSDKDRAAATLNSYTTADRNSFSLSLVLNSLLKQSLMSVKVFECCGLRQPFKQQDPELQLQECQ